MLLASKRFLSLIENDLTSVSDNHSRDAAAALLAAALRLANETILNALLPRLHAIVKRLGNPAVALLFQSLVQRITLGNASSQVRCCLTILITNPSPNFSIIFKHHLTSKCSSSRLAEPRRPHWRRA